ncbi:glycoside hydrolase family 76 protein [Lacticaseibacillus parakribbianus]|uniref:glycoside hydrolase family 76 protein n=1 Tax=Lacticaseibacillus parakribbianus TaxID=2970927 RepID=UPI0021CB05EB|nr:glycoside hydrolase family 76 protein [Lacticaseibacillus parakribbianus]
MTYSHYADIGQQSLDDFYLSKDPIQRYNNAYPITDLHQNDTFNYWWIAHLVDVRLDAYLRTKDAKYLELAEQTYDYNKTRNHGTLLHVYYDDMLWNALAALRLFQITGKAGYLDDAKMVCDDIFRTAWNDNMGGGFAWTRMQLDYKNTPANAPVMILALRLYQIEPDPKYLEMSKRDLEWMRRVLVNPDTLFVEDGINRNKDGQIDTQWQFTYNQGVYIGALLEFYHVTGEQTYLDQATKCAHTSLDVLVKNGVFADAGDGGDIGLFKGILYRYMTLLIKETDDETLTAFTRSSCDILIAHGMTADGKLLPPRDWNDAEPTLPLDLSDEIGAVMSLEAAAALE